MRPNVLARAHAATAPALGIDAAARTGRALSIQQPWAWLIAQAHKPVENRDWPTKLRGVVGIHAGKTFDRAGWLWVRETFPDITLPQQSGFAYGGIVGRARLVDCVQRMDSPWFCGAYGFVFADAEPLPLMPCRGQLGFFTPTFADVPDTLTTDARRAGAAALGLDPRDFVGGGEGGR